MENDTLYTLEIFFKDNWMAVVSSFNERTVEEGKTVWLKNGVEEKDIRIVSAEFKFNTGWRGE